MCLRLSGNPRRGFSTVGFLDLAVFPARARNRYLIPKQFCFFEVFFARNTSPGNTCWTKMLSGGEIVPDFHSLRIALCRLFSIRLCAALTEYTI